MFGSITLLIKDFFFFLNFLFQTKEQQDQLLNQSNEVFLYCGFLDYRSEILTHTVALVTIPHFEACNWTNESRNNLHSRPRRQTVLWLSSFPLFCFSVCVIDLTCLCSSNEGIWSNEGCVRSEGNVTYSVCLCNHLTNFAILMQVVPLKVGLISGYFPVSEVRINVAPSSQVLSALHRWASAQESAKQWWFCFAQPCKNGVNYRLVSTASTHSFKNKHLFKMYLFCSSRCILLSVFINFARLWCLFFECPARRAVVVIPGGVYELMI